MFACVNVNLVDRQQILYLNEKEHLHVDELSWDWKDAWSPNCFYQILTRLPLFYIRIQ